MDNSAIKFNVKVKKFEDLIEAEFLERPAFETLCASGVPDGQGRRSLAWKILLNYLPEEKQLWKDCLEKHRGLYKQLVDEVLPTPSQVSDHPLNPDPESQWQSFFKDNETLLQVDRDTRRLYPDISFFSQRCSYPLDGIANGKYDRLHYRVQQTCLDSQTIERKGLGISKLSMSKKKAAMDYAPLESGEEAHWEVVERILFIYSKLNPGQSYVQGMNEIIGPIYYVFATDPKEEWAAHAEADCFFCFTNIMSDIRDFFIRTLDDSESGINGMMKRLMNKIKLLDPAIENRFVAQDIRPQYFSFRWLSLILSQEFNLPDVLRIWDSVLSDETRRETLLNICCAMLLLIRDQILSNDFSDNMKLLQNFPQSIDVQRILFTASNLSSS